MGSLSAKKIFTHAVILCISLLIGIPYPAIAENGNYIDTHTHLNAIIIPAERQDDAGPQREPFKKRRGPRWRNRRKLLRDKNRAKRMKEKHLKAVEKDYVSAAENLISQMDALGIKKALIMPPPQNKNQKDGYTYTELLPVIRKFPHRLALVAGGGILNPIIHATDPSEVNDRIRKEFEREAEKILRDGAKGFGEMTALHLSFREGHIFSEVRPDHPLFLLLADIAARNSVPIDLHMEAVPADMDLPELFSRISNNNPPRLKENITGLERLLAHNRNAVIIWQHIGWDNTGYMTIELLKGLLEKHPNLYLSLRVEELMENIRRRPTPNRIVDERWKIKPEWIRFFEEYPDRFMIGADEFIGVPGHPRRSPQSLEETWGIIKQLPEGLAQKIGHDNAAGIFHLD